MAPVDRSICWRTSSPVQSTVVKVELKTKLSPEVTLGLLVVAAAAAPILALTPASAAARPAFRAFGSLAL